MTSPRPSYRPLIRPCALAIGGLMLVGVGCGEPTDDDDNTSTDEGIAGAWVGNGDALVAGSKVIDDYSASATFPEEVPPQLGNPIDGCDFPTGLSLFPEADVGPQIDISDYPEEDPLGGEGWTTQFLIDSEIFSLSHSSFVDVAEDPIGVGAENYRTGQNAYIIDIYHPDADSDESFDIRLRWSSELAYDIPTIATDPPLDFETAEVSMALASSAELFVTTDGECAEADLDEPIFAMDSDQDSEDVDESTTITIDGQRATLVLYALGEVDVDSRSTGTGSEEMVTAALNALFEIEVLDEQE